MTRRRAVIILVTVLVTVLALLLAANFVTNERQIDRRVSRLYGTRDPAFLRDMGVLLGPALLPGNHVTTLENGDEIFPAMLRAIRGAQKTISFETFIYWSGDIGREFVDALVERAHAGVKVHVLLDWVGSQKMDQAAVERMRASGVDVRKYHPLHWYTMGRMNNRTHRKLLVVDGRVGFTGGVGIADEWTGHSQDARHWRDTHYQVEGPVVAQMQAAFLDNWVVVSGEVLHGEDYFPALEAIGGHTAQMFMGSPSGGSESMQLMYLLSLTAASESIHISASYFVPDELTIQALVAARERGVRVQIITPGTRIDTETVRRASRALWGELLRAGVEIYEFQPTMYHVKLMVVDGLWTSVGSTNFDNRSFRLNAEANLNVYDTDFAHRQIVTFERDRARAKRITYEAWRERPVWEKAWEHAAALLRFNL